MKWLWMVAGLLAVEVLVLIALGRAIGLLPTIVLLFVIGTVGAWLAKSAGGRVIHRWREALARGEVPQEGLLDGALILAAGALLLMPGVITDVLGAALLIPSVRRIAATHVRRRIEAKLQRPGIANGRTDVIDVEGEVIEVERKGLPRSAQH